MKLTPVEIEYLSKDPMILQILIDAYDAGAIKENPWNPRHRLLVGMCAFAQPKPLCKHLGDCDALEYRRAQKVVKTYEKHFKNGQ